MSAESRSRSDDGGGGRLTRRVALTGAAAASASLACGGSPIVPVAAADKKQERVDASLSAALTIELSAVEAYGLLVSSGVVQGRARRAISACRRADRRHGHALSLALTSAGAPAPAAPAAGDIAGLSGATSEPSALALAISLEQQAVTAYLAALHAIGRQPLVRTLAEIIAADAQHLALLRGLAGLPQVPAPFENGTA